LRGWGRYDFLPVYSLPPPPNGSLIIPPMSCHGRVDYTERRKTERKNVSNEHYITGPQQREEILRERKIKRFLNFIKVCHNEFFERRT